LIIPQQKAFIFITFVKKQMLSKIYLSSIFILLVFISCSDADFSIDEATITPHKETKETTLDTGKYVIYNSDKSPYFTETPPTPTNKKWVKIEELSDEFNEGFFDETKWHRDPSKDGFGWFGRFPGLFEAKNVTVSDGSLNVTTLKYSSPKNFKGKNWTHGGAIVRSKATAKQGQYYECRMKANKTVMSSTFWIAFQHSCNNKDKRKLELDIQECVGRVHSKTHNWAKNFTNIFASNTWRHQRDCDTEIKKSIQTPTKTILAEKNNSRYFVYGCWWKSPKEILFYIDGKLSHSITNPSTDFDIEGHLTMAIETYNWNPVGDDDSIFETGSFDDLTTKYDWIRAWKLENK